MSLVALSHPTNKLYGGILLPTSKSISNRALLINASLGDITTIKHLSNADDTLLMQKALPQLTGTIHLKNAGTCMRFLTAYFAAKPGSDIVLECDARMEKRPIESLVNTLQFLGANIEYVRQNGFPPLHIKGKSLIGKTVAIDASESSQFVSALMLIAPLIGGKLTLQLTGNVASKPYIDMTAEVMRYFGLSVNINYPQIHIDATPEIKPNTVITIEKDWSAASYWYQIVALSTDAEIVLKGLTRKSVQGDSSISEYMKYFGVETTEINNGLLLKKVQAQDLHNQHNHPLSIELTNEPDLAPCLVVCAAASNRCFLFTGLHNLILKESNRIEALVTELSQLGFDISHNQQMDCIVVNKMQKNSKPVAKNHVIQTYGDHRMAMAFAPLALVVKHIVIENPDVVKKSYPHFWDDLKKVGFVIEEI